MKPLSDVDKSVFEMLRNPAAIIFQSHGSLFITPYTDTRRKKVNQTATLGEIAVADYRKAQVFKKYGLDFSFKGKKTLKEACAEKSIPANKVERDLVSVRKQPLLYCVHYEIWELDYLADFIITNHHQYVRKSLECIHEACQKTASAVRQEYPYLNSICEAFKQITLDMHANMIEEEQILFPLIRFQVQVKKGNVDAGCLPAGSAQQVISRIELQHETVRENIEFIRSLTNNYTFPDGGSSLYTLLFQLLNEFDNDLQQHGHIENNILFPKTIELEKENLEKSRFFKRPLQQVALPKDRLYNLL